MTKRKIINRIKSLVEKHQNCGCVTMAMMETESSPCIASLGQSTHQLVETLYKDVVEAIVYVHDREEDASLITYENLSDEILNEILEDIEQYDVAQGKLYDNIRSEDF
jgi:hypothetical protein